MNEHSAEKDVPAAFVMQVGPHRWRAWATLGVVRFEQDYGSFARTREKAESKALALLAHATREPGEVIRALPSAGSAHE